MELKLRQDLLMYAVHATKSECMNAHTHAKQIIMQWIVLAKTMNRNIVHTHNQPTLCFDRFVFFLLSGIFVIRVVFALENANNNKSIGITVYRNKQT